MQIPSFGFIPKNILRKVPYKLGMQKIRLELLIF